MKKNYAVVVAILLCIPLMPTLTGTNIAKANGGGPFFSMERDKSIKRNGSVSLLISVSDNPGFVTAPLEVEYDPGVLTLTSVDSLVSEMPISQYAPSLIPGVQRILLVNILGNDWNGNGQVARLNFDVKDDAPEGESRIDLSFPAGLPANSIPEYLASADTSWGSVVVINIIYGDLDDSGGDPDSVDLVHMMKCLAIPNYLFSSSVKNPAAADMNDDGTVADSVDLVLLMRLIAGWDTP